MMDIVTDQEIEDAWTFHGGSYHAFARQLIALAVKRTCWDAEADEMGIGYVLKQYGPRP
jgi:hypothetical protein